MSLLLNYLSIEINASSYCCSHGYRFYDLEINKMKNSFQSKEFVSNRILSLNINLTSPLGLTCLLAHHDEDVSFVFKDNYLKCNSVIGICVFFI